MYRYLFFDLDGTLTDSKEGIINSVRYAMGKMELPLPAPSVLLNFIGPPLHEAYMEYCGLSREQAAEGVTLFRERYNVTGYLENEAAPGMLELCQRLKEKGFVMAVASSKTECMCLPICQRFGFAESMAVITGSLPGADWTKVDVIRETMRRLNLTEADVPSILMVGDRKFDVLGAKALGIDCVGVEFFGYAEPGELAEAGAVAVVRTPEELEAYILNH